MKKNECKVRKRKTAFVEIFRTTPPRTVCPNFYVLAHANGCTFSPQCSYCYLKSSFWYLKDQLAFSDIERMINEIRTWIARDKLESYMLNTGNLSDSLTFEKARPLMKQLVEVFRKDAKGRPHSLLVVTKGGTKECGIFFDTKPCRNVVISFSVNCPEVAERHERGAAPVNDRFRAAEKLKKAGWRVRIRVDPMFLGHDYSGVLAKLLKLRPESVTLGSLRAEYNLPKFAGKKLFKDLQPPPDRKGLARYALDRRIELYRPLTDALKGVCKLGLCEEEPSVWDALGLDKAAKSCNCCA